MHNLRADFEKVSSKIDKEGEIWFQMSFKVMGIDVKLDEIKRLIGSTVELTITTIPDAIKKDESERYAA